MERIYRFALLLLFVIGFVGAVASADRSALNNSAPTESTRSLLSLIKDVHVAQEANAINSNTWTQDVSDINEDGLSKVEQLLSKDDDGSINTHVTE